jgi:regulator of protease activity HflC (stomatin/prohibitin superfamily)
VVLAADGEKQSMILRADGQAEAIKRVADAHKYETETVYQAIHTWNPTKDLIAIKYLETLQKMSEGPATKILLPLETAGLAGAVAGAVELLNDSKNDAKKS